MFFVLISQWIELRNKFLAKNLICENLWDSFAWYQIGLNQTETENFIFRKQKLLKKIHVVSDANTIGNSRIIVLSSDLSSYFQCLEKVECRQKSCALRWRKNQCLNNKNKAMATTRKWKQQSSIEILLTQLS